MSQENVDLVMRLYSRPDVDFLPLYRDDDRWARSGEALLARYAHQDIQSVRPGLPGAKTHTGIDGFRALYLDWLSPWVSYRVEVEEGIDCGDRVLVLLTWFGRLGGSTQEVAMASAEVWTFRDGKIARLETWSDRAEALKAVGLE